VSNASSSPSETTEASAGAERAPRQMLSAAQIRTTHINDLRNDWFAKMLRRRCRARKRCREYRRPHLDM